MEWRERDNLTRIRSASALLHQESDVPLVDLEFKYRV